MNLQELQERSAGLDQAIANATQGLYMLQGHKAEVDYQISEMQKVVEVSPEVAIPEELPVE